MTDVDREQIRKDHPAKWSEAVLLQVRALVDQELHRLGRGLRLLDPFAGVDADRLVMPGVDVVGVEIEPEWADVAQTATVHVGDSRYLHKLFPTIRFDVLATSPAYGNRMADHHDAKEVCSKCNGAGLVDVDQECAACAGKGKRDHKRLTYRHRLGRPLTDGNSGGMPFGAAYRQLHEEVYRSALDVLNDGALLIVNASNSIPGGKMLPVVEWHLTTLLGLGTNLVAAYPIRTRRMGFGANREKRVEFEHVLAVRKLP